MQSTKLNLDELYEYKKEHDLITNYALKGTIEDYFRKQKETKNGK